MGGWSLAFLCLLAFCDKDELIFVERFFQTMGLVLAWGSFTGWRVLYSEVFIRACQFRDSVLCHKDIRSKVITYVLKIERFKVNFNFKRFKVII
jgi:hypothetical protein